MRIILILLLTACIAPSAFSQKMYVKPKTMVPESFPKAIDKDALQAMLLRRAILPGGKKSMPMPLLSDMQSTTDKMPNGFKSEGPMLISKGNNIYESTIDRMPVLVPVVTDNMPVMGKRENPTRE